MNCEHNWVSCAFKDTIPGFGKTVTVFREGYYCSLCGQTKLGRGIMREPSTWNNSREMITSEERLLYFYPNITIFNQEDK